MGKINLTSLSDEDRAALMAEAAEVLLASQPAVVETKAQIAKRRAVNYGTQLTDLVKSVITQEDLKSSDNWEGYAVYGIPVVIEGHTLTVSVKVTDPVGKAQRVAAKAIKERDEQIAAALAASVAAAELAASE